MDMEFSSQLRRSLPCSTTAPYFARRWLEPLRHNLPEEAFYDLSLLVNELVTNSVLHSGAPPSESIDVSLELGANQVHAEVSISAEPFTPRSGRAGELDSTGRGLFLLEKLADRWGMVDQKNSIWFELDFD